jgi:hypothetical protein
MEFPESGDGLDQISPFLPSLSRLLDLKSTSLPNTTTEVTLTYVEIFIQAVRVVSTRYSLKKWGNQIEAGKSATIEKGMGVWQGVAMDSLKFHLGPPCPTLLRLMGGPLLKRPYGYFRGCLPTSILLDTQRRTPMERGDMGSREIAEGEGVNGELGGGIIKVGG